MSGLAPLPSALHPSSPLTPFGSSGLNTPLEGDVHGQNVPAAMLDLDDDLESRSGSAEPDQHSRRGNMDGDMQLAEAGEADVTMAEEEETGEDGERPALEPGLLGFLAQLQGTKEDGDLEYEEDEDMVEAKEEREAALSSPLSDLPELPNMLPTSPEASPRARPTQPDTLDDIPTIEPFFAPINGATKVSVPLVKASGTKRPRPDPEGRGRDSDISKRIDRTDPSPRSEQTSRSHDRPVVRLSLSRHLLDSPSSRSSLTPTRSDSGGQASRSSIKKRKVSERPSGSSKEGKASGLTELVRNGRSLTDAQIKEYLIGKDREVQLAICLRARYTKWGKCTQCVSKIGGDACRFKGFRVFRLDPATGDIVAPGWFESTDWTEEMTTLPKVFNAPLTETHMKKIEETVAPLLLPLITRELRHVVRNDAIKRGTDAAKHRAVCDFCSSTIFGGWFFCKKCGRDYCLVCERYFAESAENMIKSPWHLPDAARPRLLRCNAATNSDEAKEPGTRPSRGKAFHFRPDLQPVSRFSEEELRDHWLSLTDFVLHSRDGVGERLKVLGLKDADEETVESMQSWLARLEHPLPAATPPLSADQVAKLYSKRTHKTAVPIPDPSGLESKNRGFLFIDNKDLSHQVFDQLWNKGEPIVVDNVAAGLKMKWTPDDFIERFGDELCVIVDCESNTSEENTIRQFFELFKDPTQREKIFKLKDWPQTNDFADTHPALYNDFCNALPVPDYTRREGVMNLYAHFPPGPTRPDIGPKMYNAFAAKETPGGHGSTRLHMDVADAVNVMLYASDREGGEPGCAVWDLFRAEDADKIRQYLKAKFDKSHSFTDPIHSQLFYLDSAKRKELAEKHGVVSWRVYQYPGQAVFIPAGCAHQVCNLADCIKIALDFVSTHNVARCQQLTQDFRTENFVKVWKEDVLQLYNVLWYAWSNVAETRQQRIEAAAAREEEARARKARLDSLANGEDEFTTPTSGAFGSIGERHRHTGMLLAAVSSVRDEENIRSPSVGSSSPHIDGYDGSRPPSETERVSVRKANGDGDGDGDIDMAIDGDGEIKEEPDLSRAEETRAYAAELLEAMLKANEPPPPPEARAPSAATRWGKSVRNEVPLPAGMVGPNLLPRKKAVARARGKKPGAGAEAAVKEKEGKEDKEDKEGEKGEKGKEGKEGTEGKGGTEGKDGEKVKDGKDGRDDKDGKNGKDCKDDKDGEDGKDGQNGNNKGQEPLGDEEREKRNSEAAKAGHADGEPKMNGHSGKQSEADDAAAHRDEPKVNGEQAKQPDREELAHHDKMSSSRGSTDQPTVTSEDKSTIADRPNPLQEQDCIVVPEAASERDTNGAAESDIAPKQLNESAPDVTLQPGKEEDSGKEEDLRRDPVLLDEENATLTTEKSVADAVPRMDHVVDESS